MGCIIAGKGGNAFKWTLLVICDSVYVLVNTWMFKVRKHGSVFYLPSWHFSPNPVWFLRGVYFVTLRWNNTKVETHQVVVSGTEDSCLYLKKLTHCQVLNAIKAMKIHFLHQICLWRPKSYFLVPTGFQQYFKYNVIFDAGMCPRVECWWMVGYMWKTGVDKLPYRLWVWFEYSVTLLPFHFASLTQYK